MNDAIIIGAGVSGLLSAIKLDQAGLENWVILEKADDVGGTWHENDYPGCCCDVPSHLYSYSFAPNPDWSRGFAPQPEIKAYFRGVAEQYELLGRICFGTEALEARYDEASACWTVTARDGRRWTAPLLILGTGQLNKPSFAPIPGRESFAGPQFHSAQWDYGVDLTGKSVAVIGSGASAIQFIPPVTRAAGHTTVFQRSANWIMQRNDKPVAGWTKRLFALFPPARLALRGFIYWAQDQLWPVFERPGGKVAVKTKAAILDYMHSVIKDPELRAKLTPDYEIGCKRILVSDDFYPALTAPNVALETRPIAAIEPEGVRLADDTLVRADVLIWGTGFDTHHFIAPLEILGRAGHRLADDWKQGAEAYRGVSVTGYPNLFILYGPNTNTGHISIIFMIEQQVGYMMQAIARLRGQAGASVEVRAEAQAGYNQDLQARLARSVWATGCNSWYRSADGRIPNNYVGRAGQFAREMKRFEDHAYRISLPQR